MRTQRISILGAILIPFLLSCEERVVSPAHVAQVRLQPDAASIPVGKSEQFLAQVLDGSGNALTGRPVSWSVADPDVAEIDGSGRVVGLTMGETRVIASSEGTMGEAVLRVTSNTVAEVEVTPAEATVIFAATASLSAVVRATDGTVLTDRTLTWTSDDNAIATVDAQGVVTGRGLGSTTIRASVDGESDASAVRVEAPEIASIVLEPASVSLDVEETEQLAVTVRTAGGGTVAGLPLNWRSLDAGVARVTSSGLVTAVAPGQTQVIAEFDGRADTTAVTVLVPRAATVEVNPSSIALQTNDTLRLEASARDIRGDPVAKTFTWSSRASAIASVDVTGLVRAGDPGVTWIIASADGVSDSTRVQVSPRAVESVVVLPGQATVEVGETEQFAALVLADDGSVLARDVSWSSSNEAVATVDDNGLATSHSIGQATISATAEGVTGTAVLNVSPPPVATVTVTPAQFELDVGDTRQLSATPLDAGGDPIPGLAVSWSSASESIASVNPDGLVTGEAAGSTQIRATIGGVTGTSAVTVNAPVAASIDLSPSTLQMVAGESGQLQATIRDEDGNIISRPITWSSKQTAVVTVNNSGAVTAVSAGQTWVVGAADAVRDSTLITVTALTAGSVEVSPASLELAPGESGQLQATVRNASGDIISRPVTWSTKNGSVATVNDSGEVTAVGVGQTWIVAEVDGVRDSASVAVAATVAKVEVDPSSATLEVDDDDDDASVRLRARAYDHDDKEIKGLPVLWASDRPLVAVVNSQGVVTPGVLVILGGQVVISATIEGVVGTSTITIELDDDE